MSKKIGTTAPARGEIWEFNLDPTTGREQARSRPALIVSANELNHGPRDLVVILPITTTPRGFPSHIPVNPPEGGLTKPSLIMTEQIRSVSKLRLGKRYGTVSPTTMARVDQILQIVLAL